jgi:hypothetical protein
VLIRLVRFKLNRFQIPSIFFNDPVYIYMVCVCINIILMVPKGPFKWTLFSSFPTKIYMQLTCNPRCYMFHPNFSFIFDHSKNIVSGTNHETSHPWNSTFIRYLVVLKEKHKKILWKFSAFFVYFTYFRIFNKKRFCRRFYLS